MFIMYYYKTKASVILNSSTLASDAACSLGCIKLSFVLCAGSVLFMIWHKLWWVDAATSIIMGIMVGYEGYQTIKTAKDKQNFRGGCGCCGANKSGLSKYLMEKIEKEINTDINLKGSGFIKCDNDDCCDTSDDEIECGIKEDTKIDCCNEDGCCNNDNITNKASACCDNTDKCCATNETGGDCCQELLQDE